MIFLLSLFTGKTGHKGINPGKQRHSLENGNLPLKSLIFSFFIAVCLFFTPQKTFAQISVSTFTDFLAITTTNTGFDISISSDIFFTTGGFNILSGTINGNGHTLNGNGNAGFKIQGNGTEKDVSFTGDITFNNFSNSAASSGTAVQGGGLFVGGSTQNAGSGTAIVMFLNSIVNFTNNKAASGGVGTAAQGGGLFAGGTVSAGENGGANTGSGGTTIIIFTSSTINFTSNSAISYSIGTAAQGGGLFAGGAVSAGVEGSTNTGSGGTTTITFTSSTINFISNSVTAGDLGSFGSLGTAAQGGGFFAGGAVSAGAHGENISGGGITTITFTSSTVNFTSNSATSGNSGAASQGGGLFAGGAASAGVVSTAYGVSNGGINISSGGAVTIIFTSSTVNFTGNSAKSGAYGTAAQGGGLFAGGTVSAGTNYGGINISSGGTVTITFTSSTINFTGDSAATPGTYGMASQGGGLFAGGAVSAGACSNGTNISSGAITTITFTSSTVNFTSNSVTSGAAGAIAQGGGFFAGGAVSVGANYGTNISSGGTAIITFTGSTVNFTNNDVISGVNGAASQGGGLFAGGAVSAGASNGTNTGSNGITTITFTSSTINFTSNSATSGYYGTASQGGGLFAGGAVSAGTYCNGVTIDSCMNTANGGSATVTFTSSTVSFISNNTVVSDTGTAAQGGGLFAGGAVSAGAYGNGYLYSGNTGNGGATTITFDGSTINFISNSAISADTGTASQGGGLFAGGAVSAGAYGSGSDVHNCMNTGNGGTTTITFDGSTINFTSNSATSGNSGTASQGGGLFAGGAVSAGASGSGGIAVGINISSSGTTTITFSSSTVNIAGNQVTSGSGNIKAQGGGIFEAGSDSAGTDNSGSVNISADGTATIDFINSNISISSNTAGLGGGIFEAGSAATDSGTASSGNAVMNFTNSIINFTCNKAAISGGAIYAAGNFSADSATAAGGAAVINFTSSTASFTGNAAVSGGAIYNNSSDILFTGSKVIFNNNTAGAGGSITSGGAVFSVGTSTIIFTGSTVDFAGNSAASASSGTAVQGGGLFVCGSTQTNVSADTATVTFFNSTVNFTSNSSTSGDYGTAAQGGGFFAGGAVSAGVYGGTNSGSGGVAAITFAGSTVNLISNSVTSVGLEAASQGGGLFAGGAVSAGMYGVANTGSSGTAAIIFTSSTVNITGNSAISSSGGTAAQGGGMFAGGAVSAGARVGNNISSSGTVTIIFTSSTINFASNSSISGYIGTAAQGGGFFAGGAVSAGAAYGGGANNSSGGESTIIFTSSTVSFIDNSATSDSNDEGTAAQGGGLFVGGAVSAGTYLNSNSSNNSSSGASTITFISSTVNFTSNSVTSGSYGATAQGGGLFVGGALSAGTYASTNTSCGGVAIISFTSSTVNFTSNSVTSGGYGTTAQGGGLFAGGAVSAGAYNTGINVSSGGVTTITFTSSTVNFISNSVVSGSTGTAAQGGGLFAGGAVSVGANYYYGFSSTNLSSGGITGIVFTSSTVSIAGNQATSDSGDTKAQGGGIFLGGAVSAGADTRGINISADGTATIDFTGSNIGISGNTAGLGGGIFEAGSVATDSGTANNGNAVMNFTGSTTSFTGNIATSSGGAIYIAGNFSADSASATNGSAIINFISSNVSFTSNTAANSGGAIYNSAGSVILSTTGSYTSFISNISDAAIGGGGAIYNLGFVTLESAEFISNKSNAAGGAVVNLSGGVINLGNTVFALNASTATGGAITNVGTINGISGTTMIFTSNNAAGATGAGGAIYNTGTLNFNSVVFTDNKAFYGGALYDSTNSNSTFTAASSFNSNISQSDGGAVYAIHTQLLFADAVFNGNIAGGRGGAIYMTGSTVTFNTDSGKVVFSGNMSGGAPNDVYMDINSQLNISGANAIRFEDGIVTAAGSGIAINKSGAGAMYLGGNSRVWGDFNISGSGDIVMTDSATYVGKALVLGNTSAGDTNGLDMHNGTVNTVEVSGDFTSKTNLKMDIFSDGSNDQIKSETAHIGGNLDIFAGVGTYNEKEYDLIITSGTGDLYDEFSSSTISRNDLQYSLVYESGTVKLTVTGHSLTNFGELKPLTYNQSEMAKVFNKISPNPGQWSGILNDMAARQNSGSGADIAAIKDFLARTSGYFSANVIRNMAADSPNNEVYDKIRNHAEEQKTNSGLWVQLRSGLESFKKDENSPEDYNDVSYGVMFGFDRFLADKLWNGDLMWGVYGRVNKDNIEQGNSKAGGSKTGLGLYGGYLKDEWELKAMVLGEYDAVSTERADYAGDIAKADINGVTVSADIEAALKIWMNDNMIFRPYAGLEAANTSYGGFKESGGGMYDLDTQSGNYLRTAGRIGAGLDYEKGIWIWYANVECKYIFEGTSSEITSRFVDTAVDFNSRGAEEGNIQAGIGAGGEVMIAENWKLFANGKYYMAERYENLYGNIGVRYLFGKNKNSEAKK